MYSVAEIPLVITDRIMQYACYSERDGGVGIWKRNLQLLSICRTWRQAASRRIFMLGYIHYSRSQISPDVLLNTNMNLITANNHGICVKNMDIIIGDMDSLRQFFEQYEELFRFDTQKYTNVVQFSLSILKPIRFSFSADSAYEFQNLVTFDNFAQSLTKNMPAIEHLTLEYTDDTGVTMPFNRAVFSAYHSQLSKLYCTSVPFSSEHIFSNVTNVGLTLDPSTETLLPRLNAPIIKKLYLGQVPHRFSWKYFQKISSPRAPITFSSLHTLTLSYLEEQIDDDDDDDEDDGEDSDDNDSDSDEGGISDSSESDDESQADVDENQISEQDRWERDAIVGDLNNLDRCRVIFPKLEYANIYNTPGNPVLNSVYTFPAQMSMIYIYNSFPALKLFECSGIKFVKSVEFYFTNIDACNKNDFYGLTSNFFEDGNIDCEYSKMSVPRSEFDIDWSLVSWGTLQHLVIGECSVSELSTILGQCPRVEDIKLESLVAEESVDNLRSRLPPGLADHIMHISQNDDLSVQKSRLAVSSAFLNHSVLSQIKVSECTWKKKDNGAIREKRKGADSSYGTMAYEWSLEI